REPTEFTRLSSSSVLIVIELRLSAGKNPNTESPSNSGRKGMLTDHGTNERRQWMSLLGATSVENKMPSSFALKIPDGARILIVCDDESDTERLNIALRKAGLASECAKSIAAGCEAAKSGRFQVVVSKPLLSDGSWRRLIDISN